MAKTNTKYIFVSGGVMSGVGKGITAASLGAILKAKGFKISMQKCDPYFNVDAGQLDPNEHGETFITKDGAETDLDLGHYERFLDEEMTSDSTLTSGKLYKRLIDAERTGHFGGKTVQLVPHVTGLIQQSFLDNAKNFQSDIHIVEIGGTVGDLEGSHFIEAIRAFPAQVDRGNCFFVHVCYVPWLSTSHEFKTKPAQNSLRDLREYGIIPDMIIARLDSPRAVHAPEIAKKLATFCGINAAAVVLMHNANSVYEVPLDAVHSGALAALHRFTGTTSTPTNPQEFIDKHMPQWQELAQRISSKPSKKAHIGIIARHTDNTDTYLSIVEALKAAAWAESVDLAITLLKLEKALPDDLVSLDGILVPDTTTIDYDDAQSNNPANNHNPSRENTPISTHSDTPTTSHNATHPEPINPAAYALKHQKPFLGIGINLQTTTTTSGNHQIALKPNTKTAQIYHQTTITERHRKPATPDPFLATQLKQNTLIISGTSTITHATEFVESPTHPFFIATATHPEFRSRPTHPHPLFASFIKSLKSSQ